MKFETVGDIRSPAVIMLNGSFTTGQGLREIAERLSDTFYVILPTYDGHYEQGGEFTTREDQAAQLLRYCADNAIEEIALLHGLSMGAEIALDLFAGACREETLRIHQCLLDGGPFFSLPFLGRLALRRVFRRLVSALRGKTIAQVMASRRSSRGLRLLLGAELSQYREMIEDMLQAVPCMSDRSVDREADACCSFDFPAIRPEMQQKLYFTWSVNESARRSRKKMERLYPGAVFADAGNDGHCGLMLRQPENYAALMRTLASSALRAE